MILYDFHLNDVSFVEARLPNAMVQASIFHDIIKYFVKGIPHSWKSNVYIQILS